MYDSRKRADKINEREAEEDIGLKKVAESEATAAEVEDCGELKQGLRHEEEQKGLRETDTTTEGNKSSIYIKMRHKEGIQD